VNTIDDLDDPNSTAPLPEDPSAASIDDYQPGHTIPSSALPAVPNPGTAAASIANPGEVTDFVTSGFGSRVHPITGDHRFHTGVDLRAAEGAPIRAAADGVVRQAGPRGGYGNAVEIDHGDGTSTLYAHASALLVRPGQRVERGEPVGLVGQTGQATGPHLHFELRHHDHPVNPTSLLLPSPTGRALNSYRERVEDKAGGTLSGADGGES
jgi:murein DD-endopeptidase MepM/ murein hydrolase activator NlpD